MSQVMIVYPGSTVSLISTLDAMRGFVHQSIHWSVGPSVCPTTRQPDKKQSQEIPKTRTYDFFPTARAAFIGIGFISKRSICSVFIFATVSQNGECLMHLKFHVLQALTRGTVSRPVPRKLQLPSPAALLPLPE